jgi:hypothetical protein
MGSDITGGTTSFSRAGAVVPAHAVRRVDSGSPAAEGEPAPGEIRTVEEGGAVRYIEFRCACGQHVRIECVYPGDPA